MLRKHPGFSAVAVATLALGIGANTAMFTVVDRVILRPLAYRDSNRLVAIHEIVPAFANIAPRIPVNAMHFLDWQKNVRAFDQIALLSGSTVNLTGVGEPERVPWARVSWNLFPMLGARPQLGRLFLKQEDQPGRNHEVVLSYGFWQERFAGDPAIIGRKILLDDSPYTVIGVLPASFHFPKLSELYAMKVSEERPEIWTPFALRNEELDPIGDFNYACIARLRHGVTLAQALAELNIEQARIAKQAPVKIEFRAALVPLQQQITGRSRTGLELLLAAVGAVLLIVCVNIANLLLARTSSRRRELAVRSALGASRRDLLRQMLVESSVLALAGGALGLAIAYAGVRLIVAYAPVDVPRMNEVQIDGRVLLFALAISLLAALLSGVLPAWMFAKADPQEAMKAGARRATAGSSAGRLRSALVAVEVALSAICLLAGGLLLHSFAKLLGVDKGFQPAHVVTADLALPYKRYPNTEKRAVFVRRLLDGVQQIPGVQSAGISSALPLSGEGGNNVLFLPGVNVPLTERPIADIRDVNPGYFRTMGIPLYEGRLFSEADGKHLVALVSALTAQRLWPHEDPIGRTFRQGDEKRPLIRVVGVVGDVRAESLSKEPFLTVYLPYWQAFRNAGSLVVRTKMEPLQASAEIRRVIRAIDPEMPIPQFRTMNELVSDSVAQRKFQLQLILLFALAAILLASLGIYGVISFSVQQRTTEMGIRMALGAHPADIRGMVLRQGLTPVFIGLLAGIAASFGVSGLLRSMLFGVSAADPATVSGVVILIAAVSAFAAYLPARRATQVDPATALRYE